MSAENLIRGDEVLWTPGTRSSITWGAEPKRAVYLSGSSNLKHNRASIYILGVDRVTRVSNTRLKRI